MTTPDIEYVKDGLFTRFYPNTPFGEDAYRHLAELDATIVFTHILPNCLQQMRNAGLVVRKQKKSTCTKTDTELLNELGL